MTAPQGKTIAKAGPAETVAVRADARRHHMGSAERAVAFGDMQCAAGNLAVQRLFRSGAVQAKLMIGQPGDVYEREADEVAERIVRSAATPPIQRKCAACAAGMPCSNCDKEERVQAKEAGGSAPRVPPTAEASIGSLRGGGRPLPHSVRAVFEPLFQRDFSRVRIHTGREASEAASAIQARAFVAGRDIAFAAGEYDPLSREGQKLLAHELTHVLQQEGCNGSAESTIRRQAAATENPCRIYWPLAGVENIRSTPRAQLVAEGFTFCGPVVGRDDPAGDYWEHWGHPTRGRLEYQVHWPADPAPYLVPSKTPDIPTGVCGIYRPFYGVDHIRNTPRSQLLAAGFAFCGPSEQFPHDPNGNYWERWAHPTFGRLEYQVHWKTEPTPDQKPGETPGSETPGEAGKSAVADATYQAEFLTIWEAELEQELNELWEMQRNKDPQTKARLEEFWKRQEDFEDKLDETIKHFADWDANTDPDELGALNEQELRIMQLRDKFEKNQRTTPSGDF
jgi:Domain of unknown function (DUF4157)